MTGKHWTGAETKRLRTYVEQSLTNQEITKRINRPYGSVIAQIKRLGLKRPIVAEPVDFTIRLPAALYDRMEVEAKQRGMSKGHFYRTVLEKELNQCINI